MRRLLVVLVLAASGCASTGKYSGPREWEGPIREEMIRQATILGYGAGDAKKANIKARTCSATGSTYEGPYTCDRACSGNSGCVHATWGANKGKRDTKCMFVGENWRITYMRAHEVAHWCGGFYYNEKGHPQYFPARDGHLVDVRKELVGGRWITKGEDVPEDCGGDVLDENGSGWGPLDANGKVAGGHYETE